MSKFEYGMKPIPTHYNGTTYRSRLEAQWAAFFDYLGWPYQYEPFDVQGWTPDFSIGLNSQVLVEVKPAYSEKIMQALMESLKAGFREEIPFELLYLTVGPWIEQDGLILGRFAESIPITLRADMGHFGEGLAVMGVWESPEPHFGFCHNIGSYHDRIMGDYNGNCPWAADTNCELVIHQWREAGNVVRWWKDDSGKWQH
jgi:hypothetical protein